MAPNPSPPVPPSVPSTRVISLGNALRANSTLSDITIQSTEASEVGKSSADFSSIGSSIYSGCQPKVPASPIKCADDESWSEPPQATSNPDDPCGDEGGTPTVFTRDMGARLVAAANRFGKTVSYAPDEEAGTSSMQSDEAYIESERSERRRDTGRAEDRPPLDEQREHRKSILAIVFVFFAWACIFGGIHLSRPVFEEPDCDAMQRAAKSIIRSCKTCGVGTNVLPFWGEWERSWNRLFAGCLYFCGIVWIFMGMGIVCDQFMAGIEAITDAERVVWRSVAGVRRKFRVKRWNSTVANLTLMALGSSAPEILLTATELRGNRFFSGNLGPQTIVGSAAFNLFIISAVCVTALPAPETKKIEMLGAFKVTASMSIFAYIWLLFILLVFSPYRVEIWEGLLTLLFFPVLVTLAYWADRGWLQAWLSCRRFIHEDDVFDVDKEQELSIALYGKKLPAETLHRLKYGFAQDKQEMSRKGSFMTRRFRTSQRSNEHASEQREGLHKSFSRSGTFEEAKVGFNQRRHVVLECAGSITLPVILSASLDYEVKMNYFSRQGTAVAGERYTDVRGVLSFAPGETQKHIEVPIIDDDLWQPEETFFVELEDIEEIARPARVLPQDFAVVNTSERSDDNVMGGSLSEKEGVTFGVRVAIVTILNDDIAGILVFAADEVNTQEGSTVVVEVLRQDGACGAISCSYQTVDDEAVQEADYEMTKGVLHFAPGETRKEISIPIVASDDRGEERFKLCLSEACGGAVFDRNTDGGEETAVCDIIIASAGKTSLRTQIIRFFVNEDRWTIAKELWAEQRRELLYCGGGVEEQADASLLDWCCHILALNFKLMFMIVPPPLFGGGWPCFCMALFLIGLVTMIAGDLSSLFGCCLGIPDDITAITFIALGTSLPDTLASRSAALHDATADNAVGNVTGSNSVNVFLGCGISWSVGAFYWHVQGPTQDWKDHLHGPDNFGDLYLGTYPEGGFMVPIPSLAFSVGVYTVCAVICLFVLALRRSWYAGELGGPEHAQRRDCIILVSLWVIFIGSTSVASVLNQEEE